MACSLDGGKIFSISLVRGHINDQAALNLTGVGHHIAITGTILLGDGGYKHGNIIAPRDVEKRSKSFQQYQRGVVENVNGQNDCWAVSSSRVRASPGRQLMCLRSTWETTARRSPLRPTMHASLAREENPTPVVSSLEEEAYTGEEVDNKI